MQLWHPTLLRYCSFGAAPKLSVAIQGVYHSPYTGHSITPSTWTSCVFVLSTCLIDAAFEAHVLYNSREIWFYFCSHRFRRDSFWFVPSRYSWNTAKDGVKHQSINDLYLFNIMKPLSSCSLLRILHWWRTYWYQMLVVVRCVAYWETW
jgi:hypothetical protein